MCISNVLLGGLGGFYLQTSVASSNELEQIEREWRRCFNRFARRDPSSNTLSLYLEAACWSKGRTHLVRTGVAALFTAVEKTLSDAESSPAQQAVRSAVALALHQWGCRSAPNRWQWRHLQEDLRRATSRKGARYIGDAWMLACLLLEDSCCPTKSRAHRAEAMRALKWGRWRGLEGDDTLSEGNPLRSEGRWWRRDSRMLFEPRDQGGLGLNVRPLLVQAGVVELSHLCSFPVLGSGLEGRWQQDMKAAAGQVGGRITPAMWRQWQDVLRVLQQRRIRPVRPCSTEVQMWRRFPRRQCPRTDRVRIERAARWLKKRRLEGGGATPVGVHATLLREAFQPRTEVNVWAARTRRETPSQSARAHTAVGWNLDKDKTEHFEDGGDRGRQGDLPWSRNEEWAVSAARLRGLVTFRDGDGWPVHSGSGEEIGQEALGNLPPAPQLAVRARIMLGADATTTERGYGEKLRNVRVAEDVQRENWTALCELQARMEFTHAFATDASEGELPITQDEEHLDDWGWWRRRAAVAVVSHHGGVVGGCLPDDLPADSYLGELTALIKALKEVPEGGRVLIVVDSTSPIRAWLQFRRKGGRAQRQYKEASALRMLDEQIKKLSLVFFLWQRSHCGSPVNEIADREAERLRLEGAGGVDLSGEFSREFANMWPSRINGALFSWAISASAMAAHEGMRKKEGSYLVKEEGDWEVGLLQGEVGAAAALIREEKLMVADAGQAFGRRERVEAVRTCTHGCRENGGTWQHYLFRCQHPSLCEERKLWARWVYRCRHIFDPLGLHDQVTALLSLLPKSNSRAVNSLRDHKGDVLAVRRLLCGFVSRGPASEHEAGEVKATVKELIVRGLKVLCTAVRLESDLRAKVDQQIRDHGLLRRVVKGWLQVVLRGNPLRVAALRQLRVIRVVAREICRACTAKGAMAEGIQTHVLRVVRRRLSAAREEVDKFFPDLGDEAIWWWFIQSRGWKWWARRAEGFAKEMQWPALTPSAESAIFMLRKWDEGLMQVWCRWVSKEADDRYGYQSRFEPEERIRSGVAQSIDLEMRHAWSCRAFHRLGGHQVLRKTVRRMCKERVQRRWEGLRISLENFCQFGSCSGGSPTRYREEEKIVVVLGKRSKTVRTDKEWELGNQADGRGRWAVSAILEARRRVRQRGWEFLVEWVGDHEPSWVRAGDLDRNLKQEALAAKAAALERLAAAEGTDVVERERRRARKEVPRETDMVAALGTRKRSRRLEEAEAKRRKLQTAMVVRTADVGTKRNTKRKAGMFGVKKNVWGYHVHEGVDRVHVEWENPQEGDEEVIPVSWLSEDLQAQAARLQVGNREGRCSSETLHPFFARWNCSAP